MVGLVSRRLGRKVVFVTALFLEIDGRRQIGQLDDVDVKTAGGAFGQDLVVERAGLRAHITGVDLRKILAESFHELLSAILPAPAPIRWALPLREAGSMRPP